jgi:hypothetical protein
MKTRQKLNRVIVHTRWSLSKANRSVRTEHVDQLGFGVGGQIQFALVVEEVVVFEGRQLFRLFFLARLALHRRALKRRWQCWEIR